ncbi:MAG: hypothetical protein JSR77_03375 [Planctomycetes bacterium]|nr:hypothetical protein [Planctomycetota bacterium]
MNSAPESPIAAGNAAHAGGLEPIHVAFKHNELIMAAAGPMVYMWAGLVMVCILVLETIAMSIRVPTPIAVGLAVGIGLIAIAFAFIMIRRSLRRRWARSRDGLVSDASYRLRLVGDGEQTARLVEDLPDAPFEPVVFFSWCGISYTAPGIDRSGKKADGSAAPKNKLVLPDMTNTRRWVTAIIGILSGFGFLVFQRLVLHSKESFGPLPFFAGFAIAGAISAWITPTYIRIAPGVLDVLRFGYLEKGTPRFERWDLRRGEVLADARGGLVRVWDDAREGSRGLMLKSGQLSCRSETLIKSIFRAARSRHETPPLPEDALVG